MSHVICKIQIDLVDSLPGFWRKLRRYVGWFRIEQQDFYDADSGRIVISFFTDKLIIKEGESREVFLEAKSNSRGSWYFTKVVK